MNLEISKLLNISVTQVSKLINLLKNKNYISIELIYKENSKQIEMRKLIPIVKNNDADILKNNQQKTNKIWAFKKSKGVDN